MNRRDPVEERNAMPEDNREGLRDAIIDEMINGNGISVRPVISHGYHAETGEDQITFGSYDHRSKHLLTQVMPLEMAREASANLITQIDNVDRLNAAQPNTNGDNDD